MSQRVCACVVLGIGMMLLQANAVAATLTVNSSADNGTGSLRQAITDAASGDTITFSLPANSAINLTSGELLVNKNLRINGPGANLLTVQRSAAGGTATFRIFNIASIANVTISGLTIANGNTAGTAPANGGGIANDGTVTITNSTISGNAAGPNVGGGIANYGTVTITNSTISGNSMDAGGGAGGGIYNGAATAMQVRRSPSRPVLLPLNPLRRTRVDP
jgi:hypothetical protein